MAEELILKVTGMDCDGCVKAVTRAATGAGTAPISVDLKSGEMRLPAGAESLKRDDSGGRPRHPRLSGDAAVKAWMPGTSPGMTNFDAIRRQRNR